MARDGRETDTPDECPVCGEPLPVRARMCRACGADEAHGWGEIDDDSGFEVEEDFDYEAYVEKEFGTGGPRPAGMSALTWIVLLVLILAFIGGFVVSIR